MGVILESHDFLGLTAPKNSTLKPTVGSHLVVKTRKNIELGSDVFRFPVALLFSWGVSHLTFGS